MIALRLASRVGRIKPSGIRTLLNEVERLQRDGTHIINFAIGRPDFDTPGHIKAAAKKALDDGQVHYTLNAGIIELREAISDKLKRQNGLSFDPMTQIMTTAGACEAVCVAFLGLLEPGDEVIVFTPAWTTYAAAVELAGATTVEIPTMFEDGFQPNPRAIREALSPRTRMIILNSPNNPTGAVYPKPLIAEIARIAAEADLAILSDEIYEQITFDGARHVSVATIPGMAERTLTVNGFGKSFSMTGWRVGYMAGPAETIGALMRVHQNLVASACSFSQWGALEALANPDNSVAEMVGHYLERRNALCDGLAASDRIAVMRPQGSFYTFPRLADDGPNADEISLRLLREAHVAAVPGHVFGAGYERFLRMSFCSSLDDVETGAKRVAAVLNGKPAGAA